MSNLYIVHVHVYFSQFHTSIFYAKAGNWLSPMFKYRAAPWICIDFAHPSWSLPLCIEWNPDPDAFDHVQQCGLACFLLVLSVSSKLVSPSMTWICLRMYVFVFHVYVCVCLCVCVCTRVYVCVCVCVCIHLSTFVYITIVLVRGDGWFLRLIDCTRGGPF